MEPDINEVSEKVKEYAELSKTIKITQEKLKVLNKKKKQLHKEVLPKLKTNNITKCNLPFGTLKMTKSKRKVVPNKASMKEKYISFFNRTGCEADFLDSTPEKKADTLYNYIYIDNLEFKEEHTITMSYSKEFNDQFKQLSI